MNPIVLALLVLAVALQACASSRPFERRFDSHAQWVALEHRGMQDRPVWSILIVRADERLFGHPPANAVGFGSLPGWTQRVSAAHYAAVAAATRALECDTLDYPHYGQLEVSLSAGEGARPVRCDLIRSHACRYVHQLLDDPAARLADPKTLEPLRGLAEQLKCGPAGSISACENGQYDPIPNLTENLSWCGSAA
jgi:hypothetical protein